MGHVPWELCLEVVGKSHSVALTAAGLLQVQPLVSTSCVRHATASFEGFPVLS